MFQHVSDQAKRQPHSGGPAQKTQGPKKSWLKKMLWLAASSFTLSLIGLVVIYAMLLRTPTWYETGKIDFAKRQVSAMSAEDKLIMLSNWAADVLAGTVPASDAYVFQITDTELNAAMDKWALTSGWQDLYGQQMESPQIAFRQGRVLMAARLKGYGSVVNTSVSARLLTEENTPAAGQAHPKLKMSMGGLYGGSMLVPGVFLSQAKSEALNMLMLERQTLAESARLNRSGAANASAAAAVMIDQARAFLQEQPSDAVLCLPASDGDRFLPVRLTGIELTQGQLQLKFLPMDLAERKLWLDKLKSEPASTRPTR